MSPFDTHTIFSIYK